MQYPIAPRGLFYSVQGEGRLLGTPMRFVRLAGCPVACSGCDTDYSTDKKMTAKEIKEYLEKLHPTDWIWITGGEPAIHNLVPLVEELRCIGRVALITSGHYSLGGLRGIDLLTISPHSKPSDLKLRHGDVNLVPGLKGLSLNDWVDFDFSDYGELRVTPLMLPDGSLCRISLGACLTWLNTHLRWRLGVQGHKVWGMF